MSENENSFELYFKKLGHINSIDEWVQRHDVPKLLSIYVHNKIKDCIIDNLTEGRSLLDVGCGYGFLFQRMKLRGVGQSLFGTEISPFLSHSTKLNVPDSQVVTSIAEDLPFADSTFDNVVCSEVIEHVSDPLAVIQELSRVAKVNARVIVTTPNHFAVRFNLDRLLQRSGILKINNEILAVRDRPIPEQDLKRFLSESGLKLIKTAYLSPIPEVRYLNKLTQGVMRALIASTQFLEKIPLIKKVFCNQLVFVAVKYERSA